MGTQTICRAKERVRKQERERKQVESEQSEDLLNKGVCEANSALSISLNKVRTYHKTSFSEAKTPLREALALNQKLGRARRPSTSLRSQPA